MSTIDINDLKNYILMCKRNEKRDTSNSVMFSMFIIPRNVVEAPPRYKSFYDAYYAFLDEYNSKHSNNELTNIKVATFCLNGDKAALSKLLAEQRKAKPEEIFRMAIVLRLDINQAKELFQSTGLDMDADFGVSEGKRRIFNVYKYCLENKEYDIKDIDDTIEQLKLEGFISE